MPGRGHRIIPEICLPSHAPESPSAAAPAPASFGLVEAAVHHVCDLFPFPGLVHRPGGGSAARGDRRSLTLRGQGSAAHALPWDRMRPIIECESAHLGRAIPHRSAPRA